MYNILLVPANDLIRHPIEGRFVFIAKKLIEKYGVNISMLRYNNIPTASLKMKRKLDVKSVKFMTIKSKSTWSYYSLNSASIFLALLGQLKTDNIDVIIHANILPSAIAVGLGKTFHVPLVFDYQDHFPEAVTIYFKSGLGKSLAYPVVYRVTRFNVRHSDMIVTVTNYHKEIVKGYDSSKPVEVIPNGVDTNLFKPISKNKALKELDMENLAEKTILIYYGSIDPWLDFSIVFKVIKRLVKRGFDILFFIMGVSHSKYYLEEVKEMARQIGIEDRLCFFDPVPLSRLVYYVNAADIVVVPYKNWIHRQAVPLKILESLACCKDVSVTRIPEIINRFKGLVRTYSCERELESNIMQSIEGKRQASIEEMRATAEKYSWDIIASTYYNLIEQVVASR